MNEIDRLIIILVSFVCGMVFSEICRIIKKTRSNVAIRDRRHIRDRINFVVTPTKGTFPSSRLTGANLVRLESARRILGSSYEYSLSARNLNEAQGKSHDLQSE